MRRAASTAHSPSPSHSHSPGSSSSSRCGALSREAQPTRPQLCSGAVPPHGPARLPRPPLFPEPSHHLAVLALAGVPVGNKGGAREPRHLPLVSIRVEVQLVRPAEQVLHVIIVVIIAHAPIDYLAFIVETGPVLPLTVALPRCLPLQLLECPGLPSFQADACGFDQVGGPARHHHAVHPVPISRSCITVLFLARCDAPRVSRRNRPFPTPRLRPRASPRPTPLRLCQRRSRRECGVVPGAFHTGPGGAVVCGKPLGECP